MSAAAFEREWQEGGLRLLSIVLVSVFDPQPVET